MLFSAIGDNALRGGHTLPIPQSLRARIERELRRDSELYMASASLCFVNAMSVFKDGFFTWPIVNWYYCVFFSLNALIASDQLMIARRGRSPFLINLRNMQVRQIKKPAHDAVIKVFTDRYPNHLLLSQEIDGGSPIVWMKTQREKYNYGTPGLTEPDCPNCLLAMKMTGLRQSLNAYIEHPENYAFDSDHAIAALPILAMDEARKSISSIPKEKVQFCLDKASDNQGPFASFRSWISSPSDQSN